MFPGLRTPLERFRRHLSESNEELAPLKVWQMQALSMQAAVAVVDANDAGGEESLKVLTSIAQNFPMQVIIVCRDIQGAQKNDVQKKI